MSIIGYNGRDFTVELNGATIAAVSSKTKTLSRSPVDVTTDDSDGWRTLLPFPGNRFVDVSVEGVATSANYQILLDEWAGTVNSTVVIRNANGSSMSAANGFFLGNVEFSGEQDAHVAFTAQLQSSGAVTITPAV